MIFTTSVITCKTRHPHHFLSHKWKDANLGLKQSASKSVHFQAVKWCERCQDAMITSRELLLIVYKLHELFTQNRNLLRIGPRLFRPE